MIFTNNRRLQKTTETPLQYVNSPAMTFSHKFRRSFMLTERPSNEIPVPTPMKEPPKKKTMKWGEPTWFMFHTLAEKIKPEYFSIVRVDFLNIINTICANLPCPDCARHAKSYMAGINFNAIRTKDDLRILLFRFHNEVNMKKGYLQFPYEELSVKYSVANTVNIIHYFMMSFEDKHASFRMIADDLHRSRICSQLRAWFSKNIGYFDL